MITASDRRFGIEVECLIPNKHRKLFPIGRYHQGTQIPWGPTGWNTQSDVSIHTESGHFAAEIVSPPLAGEEGLVQVVFMMDTLSTLAAKINKSCGFHIHIDASDLDEGGVNRIKQSFINLEPMLYRVSGENAVNRWDNTYCKQSGQWRDGGTSDRYQSLNLTNIFDPSGRARREGKRTVEFRLYALHEIDAKQAVAMIYTSVAMVVKSVNDGVMPIPTGDKNSQIRTFVRQNFTDTQCRIIPDAPVWDIVKPLYQNVKVATV